MLSLASVAKQGRNMARSSVERIVLAAPDFDARGEALQIARCLSKAFSSGLWEASPMPLGSPEDPHSALGIVSSLGSCPLALAAYRSGADASRPQEAIGCVLGAVLNDEVIARYGLAPFRAISGDALLAFIGIVPEAQQTRINGWGGDGITAVRTPRPQRSISLARHLFESWLGMTGLRDCRQVFIRTREQITPILRLCDENGFSYCGRFKLHFRGTVQERLVFRRTNETAANDRGQVPAPRRRREI